MGFSSDSNLLPQRMEGEEMGVLAAGVSGVVEHAVFMDSSTIKSD